MTEIKLSVWQKRLLRKNGEICLGLSGNAKQRRKTKRALARGNKYVIRERTHDRYKDVILAMKGE